MFFYFGKPKNISDLNSLQFKMEKVERRNIPILIIDDNEFEYLEILRNHGFSLTHSKDIDSIESVKAYEIILCDIKGVGKKFGSKYEGAHIIAEIRKKYPFKILIAYSALSHNPSYNSYFKLADDMMKKDSDSDEWIELLDYSIKKVTDVVMKWEKIRNYMIKKNISLFTITRLEDEYVTKLLKNGKVEGFPSDKLLKEIPKDMRAIFQSFTASILFKLIIGT